MSSYVREKVLRMPVTLSELNMEDTNDLTCDLEEKYPTLFEYAQPRCFQIAPTEELFLDYVLEYEWDANGEYGKVRELYPSEKERYKPIFQQILPEVNMNLVHLVEFCWYNCTEAPSYYSMNKNKDKFYEEV